MVIVLTGMQSINKRFLTRIILSTFNKIEYAGYTGDFRDPHFSIFDKDGVEVYRVASENDPGIDTILHTDKNGLNIVNHFDKLNTEIFEDIVKNNYFANKFCSLDVDFGLTNLPRYLKENVPNTLLHPSEFNDVVNCIKNYPFQTKVITGTFGTHFINRLKAALPNEDVHVINIIRNPSAAWLMNHNGKEKWETPNGDELDEATSAERFFQALLTSRFVMGIRGVNTVRFEDIINSGELKIGNKIVTIRDDYLAGNGWITKYESKIENSVDDEFVDNFNKLALNYTFDDFYVAPTDVNEESEYGLTNDELRKRVSKNFPKNLFDELGYSPLSKEEILNK